MWTLRLLPAACCHSRPVPHKERGAKFVTLLERGPYASRDGIRLNPETNDRYLDLLRRSLTPHFTKDLRAARKSISARAETARRSGMFRGTRCRTVSSLMQSAGKMARRWPLPVSGKVSADRTARCCAASPS